MQRLRTAPRPDYARQVESQGLSFHAREGYWTEDACYRLTGEEVGVVEAATAELLALYGEALDRVIMEGRLGELAVPEQFHATLAASWRQGAPSLYGRFDLAYDGRSPPKLLEYNADTPTSLLESAVIQWTWREDVYPEADQFNSIHERLIAAWSDLPDPAPVIVACLADNEEDWVCCTYLLDTLVQSGRGGAVIELGDIGWDSVGRWFVDDLDGPIRQLFKLYPWEWLMREEFGPHLLDCRTAFIEPMYKAACSSKGMLALLWEYFPGHPNLLETHRVPGRLASFARKPLLSREGQNVTLVEDGATVAEVGGVYGAEGCVYQALCALPSFDGVHPVIGSWVVAGEPSGIGIRESRSLITTDQSRFVPHWF
ncbi:MAG TPA: glutathionylspermidine synthase family protein [Steroidobacteraceae bacterium]|nr:glutathionylspermidine synthase family protein [Steroidobacteraceae bacterium]